MEFSTDACHSQILKLLQVLYKNGIPQRCMSYLSQISKKENIKKNLR